MVLFSLSAPLMAAKHPLHEAPLASEFQQFCQFNADGSTDCHTKVQYTILKKAGINYVSKIDLTYVEQDTVHIKEALVIQPDGRRIPVAKTQIDTKMSPNPREGFSRKKQTSVAFPNLKVGNSIYYAVHHHRAPKPWMDNHQALVSFPPKAIRFDQYQLEFQGDRPLVWRTHAMQDFTIHSSADQRRLVIKQKNRRYNHLIHENGYARNVPRLGVSSSLDPQVVFGLLAQQWHEVLKAPLPVSLARVVQLVKTKPPLEQVARLMQFVHDHYYYLGDWRASTRSYVPFSLSEIVTKGYGDCKDLAVLLVALLKAVGIEAAPALVERGAYANPLLLPNALAPNHAIVRAQLDKKVLWLDPTNPVFLLGYTPSDLQDRWAILLNSNSPITVEHIPMASSDQSTQKISSTSQILSDGSAEVKTTILVTGYNVFSFSVSDIVHGQSSTDQYICSSFSDVVANCQITRKATDFLVPIHGYRLRAKFLDQRAVLPIGSGQHLLNWSSSSKWEIFQRYLNESSQTDLYLGVPHSRSLQVEVGNVTRLKSNRLKNCRVNSPWFDFTVKWLPRKSGLAYEVREVRKVSWLSHSVLISPEFKTFLDQAKACTRELLQVGQLNT